jgi:hypothetical protein
MTTHVPLPTFTPTGLVTASEQAILQGVLEDYVAAFAATGKTLTTELTTPQGQLAQSQAFMVAAFQAMLEQLIANVDPLTSSGAYQDALGRIYFLTRQPATYAYVAAVVGGVVGATLPAGAQVRSSDGSIWASTTTVVFGVGGSANVTFQATVAGSVPAAGINDLTIYQHVANWESVSNAAPSVPGVDVESRAEFETRRADSVQIGGKGTPQSIRAAVANVPGVSDVYVYNNGSDSAITAGSTNYPIPAHSIAINVTGGDETAVANAIWSKIDCGCGYSSQTTVTVNVQDTTGYVPPYPTYAIRFMHNRPPTQVYLTVNVANLPSLPANYIPLVQQAVAATFANGFTSQDGTISVNRARIGGQIIATEFTAPVLALGNIAPVSIFIGLSAAPSSGAALTMGIDQQPVCPALNITVNAISV